MPTIKIPPVLRSSTDGHKEVLAEGESVREVLRALAQQHPATEAQLFGEEGELNEVKASISAADSDEDDNVDLAAVLGGNIRKAPAAASVDEPDAAVADAGA